MGLFKKRTVKLTVEELEKLQISGEFNPAMDERWSQLSLRCSSGEVPVYHALIPLGLLVPFDIDYRVDQHPVGQAMIQEANERAQQGKFIRPIVYQRGYWFVVSDDYPALYSSVAGMPDFVPCFVMGEIDHPLILDTHPIAQDDVPKLFGFA